MTSFPKEFSLVQSYVLKQEPGHLSGFLGFLGSPQIRSALTIAKLLVAAGPVLVDTSDYDGCGARNRIFLGFSCAAPTLHRLRSRISAARTARASTCFCPDLAGIKLAHRTSWGPCNSLKLGKLRTPPDVGCCLWQSALGYLFFFGWRDLQTVDALQVLHALHQAVCHHLLTRSEGHARVVVLLVGLLWSLGVADLALEVVLVLLLVLIHAVPEGPLGVLGRA